MPFLREYPRRSAELWAYENYDDMYIDPISLLGAETPWSDMGVLYEKKEHEDKIGVEKIYYSIEAQVPGVSNTFMPGTDNRKKERYSMTGGTETGLTEDQRAIAQTIVTAIFESPEFKFLKRQMAEKQAENPLTGSSSASTELQADSPDLAVSPSPGGEIMQQGASQTPHPTTPTEQEPPDMGALSPDMAESSQETPPDDAEPITENEPETEPRPDVEPLNPDDGMEPKPESAPPITDNREESPDELSDEELEEEPVPPSGIGEEPMPTAEPPVDDEEDDVEDEDNLGGIDDIDIPMEDDDAEDGDDLTEAEGVEPSLNESDSQEEDMDNLDALKREIDSLRAKNEEQENRIQRLEGALRHTAKKVVSQERYSKLSDLRQKYIFDEDAEREKCDYSKMSDTQFEERIHEIEENYRRNPNYIELPSGLIANAPVDSMYRPGAIQYSKEMNEEFEREVMETANNYAMQNIFKDSAAIREEVAQRHNLK